MSLFFALDLQKVLPTPLQKINPKGRAVV